MWRAAGCWGSRVAADAAPQKMRGMGLATDVRLSLALHRGKTFGPSARIQTRPRVTASRYSAPSTGNAQIRYVVAPRKRDTGESVLSFLGPVALRS